ncbi:hypothetical protein [Arachidicoccus soli]|uniref:DUF3945 domain-containing protein n=1 Tax=Arachidicoccus soli TaxID=2341117 RepID=A0A386HP23_9BACT|nr:hypothetical protein [Arachidicoccus soli]AYD47432.1 hypothetical protein D6B99_07310 [Arachidicoccus soli]
MEQKNLDYLKNQLKYNGFGEELNELLEAKMLERKENFSLIHQFNYGNDVMATLLHFSKSKETDNYFFNTYDTILKKGSKDVKQRFYVDKGNTVTVKEAYNLLSGRAVHKDLTNKEGEAYNAWIQLDFKQANEKGNYQMEKFNPNYGYDLNRALAKHHIKEMENPESAEKLISSLKKGNRQSVTFLQEGNEVKRFVEANPKFFNIAVYDNDMQRLFLQPEKKQENKVAESVQQIEKNAVKKADKEKPEDVEENTTAKKRRKRVSIS